MNTLFFFLSKTLWLLISFDHILVILLLFSCFLLFKKKYGIAKFLLLVNLFIILIITFFPLGNWPLFLLESRFPVIKEVPEKLDGIIVLAGSENIKTAEQWDQVELNDSSERLLTFIQMINKYPESRHVFSGGTGSLSNQKLKSRNVAEKLFENLNIDTADIIFESDSRNTYESAVYAYDRIKPKLDENWLLITSASHMPRSVGVFNKAGFKVIPYPVDHNVYEKILFTSNIDFSANLQRIVKAQKEWTGLLIYYLTGKTSVFFPSPGTSE